MNINRSRSPEKSVALVGREVNAALTNTKGVRRIRQRYKSDCGVACVAMVANVTYRRAFEVFGFDDVKSFYTSHNNLEAALIELGCQVQRKKFVTWDEVAGSAIIPVNHRRKRQNFHWVVFDRQAVLDPNPHRPPRQRSFERYRASGWYLLVLKHRESAR
ncbi:MAG: hypothetical protein PHP57_13795 [Sideroxydans sp.]|nr:hypothetical protein [Sideroxydans sp.]